MSAPAYPRLLGDIGGTNARFALQRSPGGALEHVRRYPTDACPTLEDAIRRYLDEEGLDRVALAAIGIANPVTGDRIRMTNHPWTFSIEETRAVLGLERFVVVNDFHALALSLPMLAPDDVVQLGGQAAEPGEPLALIGPGTGLGVSGLVFTADGRAQVALDGEGGHVTLCANDEEEERVIRRLRERFGHVSAERVLSGQGLENLHEAVSGSAPALTAADITARALAGADDACVRTVDLFCAMLGSVAGNLVLTLGARGGLYVGGGIVPRLGEAFRRSRFRARFEDKGRMAAYLRPIPAYVITAETSPALLGAARALDQAVGSGPPAMTLLKPPST
jgi:glucokinase